MNNTTVILPHVFIYSFIVFIVITIIILCYFEFPLNLNFVFSPAFRNVLGGFFSPVSHPLMSASPWLQAP